MAFQRRVYGSGEGEDDPDFLRFEYGCEVGPKAFSSILELKFYLFENDPHHF